MSLLERTHGTQRGYIRRGIFGNGDAALARVLAMFDSEPIVPVPDDSVFHGSENSFPPELLTDGVGVASNAITLKIGGAEWHWGAA
jgi:hypothetical protein